MEKIMVSEYVSIGELVLLTGTRYSTLKFYTEEGMLPFEQEDTKLTRRYKRVEAVKRIEEIMTMRQKGSTIPQIKELLP
jgi:DNA-binding transcriptional MerR regulator